jgi:hypothetical protein
MSCLHQIEREREREREGERERERTSRSLWGVFVNPCLLRSSLGTNLQSQTLLAIQDNIIMVSVGNAKDHMN